MLKGDRQIPTQWLRPLDLAIQREQRQTPMLKSVPANLFQGMVMEVQSCPERVTWASLLKARRDP